VRRLSTGNLQQLGTGFAGSVNFDGSVICGLTSIDDPVAFNFAWIWSEGSAQTAVSGDWIAALPQSISGDGRVIVGFGQRTIGEPSSGFRWTEEAGMQTLLGQAAWARAYGVSEDGVIAVGMADGQACRWNAAGEVEFLGALSVYGSDAYGANSDGSVIVGRTYEGEHDRAFRWTQQRGMRSLGVLPGGTMSWAYFVSSDGALVMGSADQFGEWGSFVWTESIGIMSLAEYLVGRGIDLAGWSFLEGAALSRNGRFISGTGMRNGVRQAFLADTGPDVSFCAADLDRSGVVDAADLALLLLDFGNCAGCPSDADGNGVVDAADIALLLLDFGACPTWYTVLEESPNPAVVYDASLREAITATGLPWRVLDKGTGIEMVLIPPGDFVMGCSASDFSPCNSSPLGEGEEAICSEIPAHLVTLTKAFYLGRTEVTQKEFEEVMGFNPSFFQEVNGFPGSNRRPADSISEWDCRGFLSRTSLRLPTEAEWEFAYRAGTTSAFHGWAGQPSGFDDDSQIHNIARVVFGWPFDGTEVVAGRFPNGFGLFDMSGNVSEWTGDWVGPYSEEPQIDPVGSPTGRARVLRGGNWLNGPAVCRASSRIDGYWPYNRFYRSGFRVARNP
jgi:formylglycine-generating enzyme required for sulfatase activity/uncharacterized membrane protein